MNKKVSFIIHDGNNGKLHMIQWVLPIKKGAVSAHLVDEALETMVGQYDFLKVGKFGHQYQVTHVLYINKEDIKDAELT
jgi:hypothetical protein|tara:strand:- start:539 stop:775 length:237 start_codon:yes stop_codon:yes gene_type:complete